MCLRLDYVERCSNSACRRRAWASSIFGGSACPPSRRKECGSTLEEIKQRVEDVNILPNLYLESFQFVELGSVGRPAHPNCLTA